MPNVTGDLWTGYDEKVVEFVSRGIASEDEAGFTQLALEAFELHYRTDAEYRKYCRTIKVSPDIVTDWQEIPAVASFPFRKTLSAALPREGVEKFYFASGVAETRQKRGPFFPSKNTRRLTASANNLREKEYLFPDIDAIRMLFMVPIPAMAPGMVMAGGFERIRQRFGLPDSKFLISFTGLDLKELILALREAEKTGQAIALLGATWGFDYFFDSCKRSGIRFNLPQGSRIVDSGGYAGRYTTCRKENFILKCRDSLGIGQEHCINALWLCESSTVYFDNVLRNSLSGIRRERCKELPPWTRITVVDPLTFKPLPKGAAGLLRHYDLTNRAMSVVVQTANVGYETENGFEVLGKWNGNMKNPDIARQPLHPGGKILSSVMDAFLGWKFSKTGRIYSMYSTLK